ncbi:MAG: response regulator [Burkholderiales bacterium]
MNLLELDTDRRPRVLLADDEPANLRVLQHVLQTDYRLLFARDGDKALQLATRERPDLILLDVMMPGLSGLEVCQALKAQPDTTSIPVIFVTALQDEHSEAEGFAVGAVDYVVKPVSAPVVRARVRTHLSLVRAEELRQTRLEIVQCLGRAAEYKDNETGRHVMRMSHFARELGRAIGLGDDEADDLLNAAAMHDVGKIGIADAILLKNGPLNEEEWVQMRRHPEMGAAIIGEHSSRLLQMARRVALGHHEKWDGSGYPSGAKGRDIPLEARIVAIADVFDALTSNRPYKKAWPVEDAVAWLQRHAGSQFDPELVERFIGCMPQVLEIRARWPD